MALTIKIFKKKIICNKYTNNLFRRTHTLVDPNPVIKDKLWPLLSSIKPLPDMENLPASLGLGAIGMPGYFYESKTN